LANATNENAQMGLLFRPTAPFIGIFSAKDANEMLKENPIFLCHNGKGHFVAVIRDPDAPLEPSASELPKGVTESGGPGVREPIPDRQQP
jgi:hypothetical protein